MSFKVVRIIDGNTIEVSPNWKWKDMTGVFVRIEGFTSLDSEYSSLTISKLNTLLNEQSIELKNPLGLDGGKIECSVYLNDIDISQYFPELRLVK